MTSAQLCDRISQYIAPFYVVDDYAALESQYDEWAATKPLAGLRILDVTPLFRNTLLKYRNLLVGGAELTVGISPFISHNVDVLHFVTNELGLKSITEQGSFDLVLDCAGVFAASQARFGYVELTRSGLEYYAGGDRRVYMADSSRIKEFETVLGTGDGLFRALQQLGYNYFSGKRLVIFGSGKVGRGILREARLRGCDVVVVTDPDTAPSDCLSIDYRDRLAVETAISGAWAVVMATGRKGALGATIDPRKAIESQALLINMGAEDEFGAEFPPQRLVENGRTLNFILDEPTHLRYIDPTMALHNFGAQFLVENPQATGLIIPDQAIEDKILKTTLLHL